MNEVCAMCGNAEIKIKPSEVIEGFYAECSKCGCTSCSCSTRELAIEDWNELQIELKKKRKNITRR